MNLQNVNAIREDLLSLIKKHLKDFYREDTPPHIANSTTTATNTTNTSGNPIQNANINTANHINSFSWAQKIIPVSFREPDLDTEIFTSMTHSDSMKMVKGVQVSDSENKIL